MTAAKTEISVSGLTIAYGDFVLLKDISFEVKKGDIFIIMGASGGGKSSLLRVLTGLVPAASGKIVIDGVDFTSANEPERQKIMQKCGILYQSGALFSSMTLAETCPAAAAVYVLFRQTDCRIGFAQTFFGRADRL